MERSVNIALLRISAFHICELHLIVVAIAEEFAIREALFLEEKDLREIVPNLLCSVIADGAIRGKDGDVFSIVIRDACVPRVVLSAGLIFDNIANCERGGEEHCLGSRNLEVKSYAVGIAEANRALVGIEVEFGVWEELPADIMIGQMLEEEFFIIFLLVVFVFRKRRGDGRRRINASESDLLCTANNKVCDF